MPRCSDKNKPELKKIFYETVKKANAEEHMGGSVG